EEGGLTVATTRPETMFGDQALMVHPDDERFKKYVGKKVYIPLTDTIIPVIEDDYVDKEFGTGIVKVTPAHDPNDFEVGVRHNLNFVLCMNDDGTMNNLAGRYEGLDRFDCRKKVVEDMKKSGHLFKINKIVHSVGHSERTGSIVEPRLSKQWFVSMDKLAKDVIEMQNKEEEKIHFHPTHFEIIFLNWLNNIQDWCISRQLWWGHRIPAWYKGEEVFVGEEKPEGEGWEQDPDVLDTWFSSALWPFSTMGWPDKTFDLERFFPNDTLVTGYDIIFFWVARMAFQSKYLLNTRPFKDVLIHGLIRDELGRKVSKSLNNGADMLEVIDKYGADTLRYFISTTGGPGQDFRYSDEKLESTWNFINKIWNIARYIGIQFDNNEYIKENIDFGSINSVDKWILSKTNQIIREVDENFEKFEFGEVARTIYNFVWDDFASWYLEMTKVVFQEEDKRLKINTCSVLDYVLTVVIKLLHPFIPFVTEEIYQSYHKDSIVISNWPVANKDFDFNDSSDILIIFDIITAIRNIRAEKNVPNSKKIDLQIECRNDFSYKTIENHLSYLQRFTNYDNLIITKKAIDGNKKVIKVLTNVTIAIPLETLVDKEEELLKLEENKTLILSEIKRCESMLGNKNFITKAPAFKIDEEKLKLKNYTKQLEAINKSIDDLR
ncbi:MAG: valine--tRNA ligase, partial [Bacilli bacterium]|nr:valine--tRNA ligase [Bacilli bacterium]